MGTMGTLRSFGELLNNWLEEYLPNVLGQSDNTVKSYRTSWEQMITFLYREKGISADKITFDTFTFEVIMEFLDWIKKVRNCKDSTRNNRRAAIVKFAKYAQNYNFDAAYKFNVAAQKVPGKKQTDSRERAAMDREQTKIMLNLPDIHDRYGRRDITILNFLYASGCRSQELCNLKVKDIIFQDDGKASVHLHGKGKKERRIRISSMYASMLKKHLKYEKILNFKDHYVFVSQRNPQMSVVAVERIVAKYAKRAKQEYPELFSDIVITPHVFRHTTATHMLETGVPLMVVSRFLGHADIGTTLIYAKMSEKDVNEKLKNWDKTYWADYMDEPTDDENETMSDEDNNLAKIFKKQRTKVA